MKPLLACLLLVSTLGSGAARADEDTTLTSRMDRARDLEADGRDAEAEKERRAVLAAQESTLGAEDKETLKTCHALALGLKKQKKIPEALVFAQRALAGRTRLLGKDDNDTDASQRLVNQLAYASPQGLPNPADPKKRPVAMVDGSLILASDVQQTINAQAQVIRYQYRNDSDRMKEELAILNSAALGTLIDKYLLIHEFVRIGGVIKPGYIDADIDGIIKESFKGKREAFLKELQQTGISLAEFRQLRQQMVIMNVMRARFAGDIQTTDEEVRSFYEKNAQLWRAEEQVKIRTLTLPKSRKDARALADSLHRKIAAGADFAAAAHASSTDSHADKGGEWDWAPLSTYTDGVCKAAAHTPKGQISAVLDLESSFIIVRVDDRRTPAPPAFEKVKDKAAEALKQEKAKERIDKKLNELREAADIQKMEVL